MTPNPRFSPRAPPLFAPLAHTLHTHSRTTKLPPLIYRGSEPNRFDCCRGNAASRVRPRAFLSARRRAVHPGRGLGTRRLSVGSGRSVPLAPLSRCRAPRIFVSRALRFVGRRLRSETETKNDAPERGAPGGRSASPLDAPPSRPASAEACAPCVSLSPYRTSRNDTNPAINAAYLGRETRDTKELFAVRLIARTYVICLIYGMQTRDQSRA